jgi:SWI/SNF-related matrix-associated actin-dependent regulator 1 of chromatin subfamily A
MELMPHQHIGVAHLAKSSAAYLADDMGLGKTIQAIVAAQKVGCRRLIVVCPASMVETWKLEISAWWTGPELKVLVYSYDRIVRSVKVRVQLDTFRPDVVVCDEAHYMKSLDAKRTKYVLDSVWFHSASYVWFLSGTPTPNGPHELYSILRNTMPVTLKNMGIHHHLHWMNHFCKWWSGDYGPVVTGAKNVPQLRELLFDSGFMLRRRYDEVEADLPKVDLRLFPIRHHDDLLTMLEDLVDQDEILRALETRDCLPDEGQHIATLRRETGKVKAEIMGKILAEELKEGAHKLVVFAYHIEAINILNDALAKFNPVGITGSTPTGSRARIVEKFQTEPSTRVFIGQITAAGVGITLTAAKDVVIVEPSWVPSENAQAIGRVRRIGQTSDTVYARMAVLKGSLDEPIIGTLRRKQRTINITIDGTKEPS